MHVLQIAQILRTIIRINLTEALNDEGIYQKSRFLSFLILNFDSLSVIFTPNSQIIWTFFRLSKFGVLSIYMIDLRAVESRGAWNRASGKCFYPLNLILKIKMCISTLFTYIRHWRHWDDLILLYEISKLLPDHYAIIIFVFVIDDLFLALLWIQG